MNRARGVIVASLIFGFLLLVTWVLNFNLPWRCAVFAVAAVPILAIWWAVSGGGSLTRHVTVADVHRDVAGAAR